MIKEALKTILEVVEENKDLFCPKYKTMIEISNQGDSEIELFVPTSYIKNPSNVHAEKLRALLGADSVQFVNQGEHSPFWAFEWDAKREEVK